jgi:hypothetical protein
MIRISFASMVLIGMAAVTTAGPRGTTPKPSPDQYRAHTLRNGTGIGASALGFNQVMKTFNSSEIDRCCLVVEVALYPERDNPLSVSMDDFAVQVPGNDNVVRPWTARAVAATIEQYEEAGKTVTTTHTGIGYGSGTEIDPVTGQQRRVHGVNTEVGGGVTNEPSGPPRPQAVLQAIEDKVAEKALPEGTTSAAVAGYLYFPRSMIPTKKKKNAVLELQYQLKDQTIVLTLE